MRVAEIFHSIQGEGRLIGLPSVFIRTSGCNLRCVWCDTPYASWQPEGRSYGVEKILREVDRYPARHVVITGGEPLLAPELDRLTTALKAAGKHITVETAATIFRKLPCDLFSLSPKLAHSTPWKKAAEKVAQRHEAQRLNFAVIQDYIDGYDYQLKFVVAHPRYLDEIEAVLARLNRVDRAKVLLMPEGTTRRALAAKSGWLAEICKQRGFGFTPRLHIELFGNRRGT